MADAADRASGRARGRAQGRGRGRARPRPEQPQASAPAESQPEQGATASVSAPPPVQATADATSQPSEGPKGDGNTRGGLSRKLSRYAFDVEEFKIPGAGKIGTEGKKIKLIANYIPLQTLYGDEFTAFMFLTDWEPRISPGARNKLIRQLADNQKWGGYTCDGRTVFLRKAIHEGTGSDTLLFALTYPKRDGTELKVSLTMKLVSKVLKNTMEYFHLLNVIFNEGQRRMKMIQMHNDFFNKELCHNVEHRGKNNELLTLQVWPGYTAAIGSVDDAKIMLCADVSHKIIATERVAHTVLRMIHNGSSMQDVLNFITGSIIYTPYSNRTWRVDDLTFKIRIDDTFATQDRQGNTIHKTYRQYFQERYNVKLDLKDQPLVVTKPKKKDLQKYHRSRKEGVNLEDEIIYLPSELCILTGLTDRQRDDFYLMQKLAMYTRQGPTERFENLKNFALDLKSRKEAAEHFQSWGLEFSNSLLSLNGRILDNIPIYMYDAKMGNRGPVPQDREGASWDKALRNNGVIPKCYMKQWVFIHPNDKHEVAQSLLNNFQQVAYGLHCDVSPPEIVVMDSRARPLKWAEEGTKRIQGRSFILFLLPRNDANMYNVIKKCFCYDYPIITQCVVSRTIQNPKKAVSVATKVLLQIACKLGYSAWTTPICPKLKMAMVVGIDVYHKRKQASVQAAVFSYNPELTQYYSSAIVDNKQMAELNTRMGLQFELGLKYFSKINHGRLPDRIIIYRDGVGDSMLSAVKDMEVKSIERTVYKKYEEAGVPPPNIVFVVVKKRLSTRLVCHHENDKSLLKNPPPGTIIDSIITKPNFCDFFLVSQMTRQGTVTPTHYNKVFDNFREVNKAVAMPTGILQKLSYVLCHLYYNWPGTIRVPAPTHYAHRLAFLVGQNIGKAPDSRLCDRLFYL